MLSKKYYKLFATAIFLNLPKDYNSTKRFISELCTVFKHDNPNFDEHRFRNACKDQNIQDIMNYQNILGICEDKYDE